MKCSKKQLLLFGALPLYHFLSLLQNRRLVVRTLSQRHELMDPKQNSINLTASIPEVSPKSRMQSLWNQYKRDHSNIVLQQQNATIPRNFTIGYYSCPLQAGNRIHHFLNSLIWAVITNRTLLWKYYDRNACKNAGQLYTQKICEAANHAADCDKVLQRASWIPAADDWIEPYNLEPPLPLSYWTTHEAPKSKSHKFWYEGAELEAGVADTISRPFVSFPQMLAQDSGILYKERRRMKLLRTPEARKRAEILFDVDVNYLYGFLFFNCFRFHPMVSTPDVTILEANETGSLRGNVAENDGRMEVDVSVVLHSRHSNSSDDGGDIGPEIECLKKSFHSLSLDNSSCDVMLLSDRPKTLDLIGEYIQEQLPNCRAIIADHNLGISFNKEHGPFSGSGFYQDLGMVSDRTFKISGKTTIFIGSNRRSSSQLIEEILAYQLSNRSNRPYRGDGTGFQTCFI